MSESNLYSFRCYYAATGNRCPGEVFLRARCVWDAAKVLRDRGLIPFRGFAQYGGKRAAKHDVSRSL